MQSSTLYTPDICYIPPTTTEVVKLFNNYLLFPAFLTDFFFIIHRFSDKKHGIWKKLNITNSYVIYAPIEI